MQTKEHRFTMFLSLYNDKRHLIKDKLIKSMKDLNELEDYIEKTEDVQLVNDFITEEKSEKLKVEKEKNFNIDKLNEEINLLYMAVTRTKNSIHIPETLMPVEFSLSSQIHVMRILTEEAKEKPATPQKPIRTISKTEKKETLNIKACSPDESRKKHKDAYKPWTDKLDEELTEMYCEGETIMDIAKRFGRTKGAIWSRIKNLELEDLYG